MKIYLRFLIVNNFFLSRRFNLHPRRFLIENLNNPHLSSRRSLRMASFPLKILYLPLKRLNFIFQNLITDQSFFINIRQQKSLKIIVLKIFLIIFLKINPKNLPFSAKIASKISANFYRLISNSAKRSGPPSKHCT